MTLQPQKEGKEGSAAVEYVKYMAMTVLSKLTFCVIGVCAAVGLVLFCLYVIIGLLWDCIEDKRDEYRTKKD